MKKYMLLFLIAHGAMYSLNPDWERLSGWERWEKEDPSYRRYMHGHAYPAQNAILADDMRVLDMYRDPATVNEENSLGETPLQVAIDHENPRAVAILLKNGAKTTFKGGTTALEYARNLQKKRIQYGHPRTHNKADWDKVIDELQEAGR